MDWSFSDVNSSISINPQKPPEATRYQVPTIAPVVPDVSLVFGNGSSQMENLYQRTSTQHADIFNSASKASKFDNGKISKNSSAGRHIASREPNETELTNIKDWYIPNKTGPHLNQGFDRYLRDTENCKFSMQTVPKSVDFSDSLVYKWGSKEAPAPSRTENVQQITDSKLKLTSELNKDFQPPARQEIIESEIDEICKFSRKLEDLCKESEVLKSGSKINKQVIESEIDQICKVSDTLQKLYEESKNFIPEERIKADQNFSKHSETINSLPKSISPKEHLIHSWNGNEARTVKLKLVPDFIETNCVRESVKEDYGHNGLESERNDELSYKRLDELSSNSKIADSDYLMYSKTMTVNTRSLPKSVYSVNKYVPYKPTSIIDTLSETNIEKLNPEYDLYIDNTSNGIQKDTSEINRNTNYHLSDTIEDLCKETSVLNPGTKLSRVNNYSQTVDSNTGTIPISAEFKANGQSTISQNFLLKTNTEALKPENNLVDDICEINRADGAKISKALERLCEESEKQTILLKTITESLHLFNTKQDQLFNNLFKKLDSVLDDANQRKFSGPEKVDAETLTMPYIESKQKSVGVDKVHEKQSNDEVDPSSEKILMPVEHTSTNQVPEEARSSKSNTGNPSSEARSSKSNTGNPSSERNSVDHRQLKNEESQFLGTESLHLSEINVPTPAFNQPTPASSIHLDIQDYEEFTDGDDDDDNLDSHSIACQNANSSLISCDGRQEIFYRKVVGQVSKLLKGGSSFKRDSTYRCTEVKKSEKMTLSGKEIVKRATIRQQQLLGINVQERSVIEETILVPAERNGIGNKIGYRLDELAGKYLKTHEHSQVMPNHTNISMATRQYLERYQILPTDNEYEK